MVWLKTSLYVSTTIWQEAADSKGKKYSLATVMKNIIHLMLLGFVALSLGYMSV